MRINSRWMSLVVAGALLVPAASLLAADHDYGRAGGAVGADRIVKVVNAARLGRAAPATAGWYGRAGGSVGIAVSDRIERSTPPLKAQSKDISNWYGRAGGPVRG